MSRPDLNPALEFLTAETPAAWLEAARANLPLLLIDHANCEKKAASTALGLMYRYVGETELLHKMSQLAREELRHFEQVVDLMTALDVEYVQLSSARYAGELHKLVRKDEPDRLVDVLILGAVVEARSCERFVRLVEVVPAEAAALYQSLVHSEARHFVDYLELARKAAGTAIDEHVARFLEKDAELIRAPDASFRFHSGVPG